MNDIAEGKNREISADCLIIGSGIGGLVAGGLMALNGHKTVMVEKNRDPGGMLRSYRRGGIECEVGLHYFGCFDPGQPLRRIFDYLGVSEKIKAIRMGVDGPIDRYVLPGFTFDMPVGIDNFLESLRETFPDQDRQIDKIGLELKHSAERLCTLAAVSGKMGSADLTLNLSPMSRWLEEMNADQYLGYILSLSAAWFGVPPEECPVHLWSTVLASYLISSWRMDGSGADMADVLAERFRELGGEIILGDPVASVRADRQNVHGAITESGLSIKAPLVIAGVHPKTLLPMLPPDSYPPIYATKIKSLKETRGVFCAHYTVPDSERPALAFNHIVPVVENGVGVNIQFFQVRPTGKPGINTLMAAEGSHYEDWAKWADSKTMKRAPEYKEYKEARQAALFAEAEKLLGPMPSAKLVDCYSPLSIRDWVNSPDGSAFGVMHSAKQLLRTITLHRTKISGLHLVGHSVLAPGLVGTATGACRVVASIVGLEKVHNAMLALE